jgi:hypothetical protein
VIFTQQKNPFGFKEFLEEILDEKNIIRVERGL